MLVARMSWNGQGNMGPSPGNGLGGLVAGDMAGGQGGNQPHATEYTLQGMFITKNKTKGTHGTAKFIAKADR